MSYFYVKEFKGDNWFLHFRSVKKLLKKREIMFVVRRFPTEQGIFPSIWATEEYLEQARNLVGEYLANAPEYTDRELRVEELANEFESKWLLYIIAIFIYYGKNRPFVFWPLFVFIMGMIFFPFFQYDW